MKVRCNIVGKIGLYKEKTCKGVQWRVRWFGEYNETTGRQRRYGKTFTLKKDAEGFMKTKDAEFEKGTPRDPSKVTLKEYAERWLHNKIKIEGVRPSTVILYRGTFDRLDRYFGDCLLRKIDRKAAQDFLAGLQPIQSAKEDLSGWSRHRILRHCKALFKGAVLDGVIGKNPFNDIPGAKCITSEWHYLNATEFRRLLDVTPTLREKALYTLAFTAGLRKAEAWSLYWTDIDFEKGIVRITNRKATKEYPPFFVKDTDSRVIPLPKFTFDLLTQLQLESPENVRYVLMGKRRCQTICAKWRRYQEQGRQWNDDKDWENNTKRTFDKRIRQAGIEAVGKKLTLHVLRKCFTQNIRNRVPENVALAITGHSSSDTANRFYSTVDERHLKEAAAVMDDLLATDLFLTFSPDLGYNEKDRQESSCVKLLKTQHLQIESP